MTAVEAFELTTRGGATDFEQAIRICESCGPYCLIGGLAVNCYVEPVYTLDADFVVTMSFTEELTMKLLDRKFTVEQQIHTINAQSAASRLRIQFTKDLRYQDFPARAITAEVLGVPARVASLADVTQRKLWAYSDPQRRFSKRQKDRLDLIRLAEEYPELLPSYPQELQDLIAAQ